MIRFLLCLAFFIAPRFASATTLLIGDSHTVGPFGDQLAKNLQQNGTENVIRYGLAGASPRHYTHSNPARRTLSMGAVEDHGGNITRKTTSTVPQLATLIQTHRPQTVIIALGENLYDYRSKKLNKEFWKKEITTLLSQIPPQTPCVWLLPTWTNQPERPPYHKSNDFLEAANLAISDLIQPRCQVISGTALDGITKTTVITNPNDWLHHSTESGHRWADAVFAKIRKSPLPSELKNAHPSTPSRTNSVR